MDQEPEFEAESINPGEPGAMADERSVSELKDRTAVSDVILAFARSLDMKDWEGCRRCFLDEIETDYSDLRGERPSRASASDFVAKRRAALEHLKTLHLRSEEHTSELQSRPHLECRLLLEKKKHWTTTRTRLETYRVTRGSQH